MESFSCLVIPLFCLSTLIPLKIWYGLAAQCDIIVFISNDEIVVSRCPIRCKNRKKSFHQITNRKSSFFLNGLSSWELRVSLPYLILKERSPVSGFFVFFRAKSCETVLLPFFSLSEQNKPEQFLVPKLEACCWRQVGDSSQDSQNLGLAWLKLVKPWLWFVNHEARLDRHDSKCLPVYV